VVGGAAAMMYCLSSGRLLEVSVTPVGDRREEYRLYIKAINGERRMMLLAPLHGPGAL